MKLTMILLLMIGQLLAAPAFNKSRLFKQADGTTFSAKAVGDQNLNWIETADGEVLIYDEVSKNFDYAKIQNGELKASGARYEEGNSLRVRAIARVNKMNKSELYNLWREKRKAAQNKKR